HLEVRPRLDVLEALRTLGRLRVRDLRLLVVLAEDVLDVAASVRVVDEEAHDTRRLLRQDLVPVLVVERPELAAGATPREDPVALELLDGVERLADRCLERLAILVTRGAIEASREVLQLVPRVRAKLRGIVVRTELGRVRSGKL